MKTSIQQQWDEVWARIKVRNHKDIDLFMKQGDIEAIESDDKKSFAISCKAADIQVLTL